MGDQEEYLAKPETISPEIRRPQWGNLAALGIKPPEKLVKGPNPYYKPVNYDKQKEFMDKGLKNYFEKALAK